MPIQHGEGLGKLFVHIAGAQRIGHAARVSRDRRPSHLSTAPWAGILAMVESVTGGASTTR